MGEMVVVYAGEAPPDSWQASMFLAGPMPRDPDAPSWRPDALKLIADAWDQAGALVVFVPEARDRHHPTPGYISQLWEERWMAVVDVMLFWVPRDMATMPGLNTNLEFGRNENSGRVVLGTPPQAVSVHYLRRAGDTHGVPVRDTMPETVTAAVDLIAGGATRTGPEREVPLLIWRTPAFQTWRRNTKLLSAQMLWAWSPAPHFDLQAWAMHVKVAAAATPASLLLIAQPGREILTATLPARDAIQSGTKPA